MSRATPALLEKIRPLLSAPDLGWVRQGLEMLDVLNEPALWEVLAEGLSIERGFIRVADGSEIGARVVPEHKVYVALRILSRTGALQRATDLDLVGCGALESVDVFRGCAALESLSLYSCRHIEDLDGLRGCRRLKFLHIGGASALKSLEGLQGCLALEHLSLGWEVLTSLQAHRALDIVKRLGLKQFSCIGGQALESLEGIAGCVSLEILDLSRDTFTGLQERRALGILTGLTGLTALRLRSCQRLIDLDGLPRLDALETLELRGCRALENLEGLQRCSDLTALDLYGCSSLKSLEGLQSLRTLRVLDLRGCRSLAAQGGIPDDDGLLERAITGYAKLEGAEVRTLQDRICAGARTSIP